MLKLIDNPPVKDGGWLRPGDVKILRLWYAQVQAGNRTFRFKDDSAEYGFDGPATAGTVARIAKARERDEIRTEGGRKTVEVSAVVAEAEQSGRLPVAEILAGAALVVAAVWYFQKRRKTI